MWAPTKVPAHHEAPAIRLACRCDSKLTEHHKPLKKKEQEMEAPRCPGCTSQHHEQCCSSAFPSFLARPDEMPSIFPAALFLLSAEENAIGPKRCWLPQALAALWANGQSLRGQHVPECTEPRPESLATGPSSGRVKQRRKSSALTLTSCFGASGHLWSSGRLSDVLVCPEGRGGNKAGVGAAPPASAAATPRCSLPAGSWQGSEHCFQPAREPELKMARARWISDKHKICLLPACWVWGVRGETGWNWLGFKAAEESQG